MHEDIGLLLACFAGATGFARFRGYLAVFLALNEQVPADVQHLSPPAPILRRLGSEPLHQGLQRFIARSELGVVVDFCR
ncbi:hypothetical protein D3C73_1365130 [compost metagenome]